MHLSVVVRMVVVWEVTAMFRYVLILVFLLVGCSSSDVDEIVAPDAAQPPTQPTAHHEPEITDLTVSPHVVTYMEGGGTVVVTVEISYRDSGLDIQALWVQMPDGTRVEFSKSFATETGTFTEDIAFPTDQIGAFSIEFWLVDKVGDSSWPSTEVIDVIGEVPSSAGGIWHGTVSNDHTGQSFDIRGVVTEHNAEGRFMINDETQFILRNIAINGFEITATISAITYPDPTFLPREGNDSGEMTGSLVERSRIEGEWSLDSREFGTVTLEYDDLYERGSDIARLVGIWQAPWGDDFVFNIDALGEIFSQTADGCVTDGQVRLIDAAYNVYRVEIYNYCLPYYASGLGVLGDEVDTDDAFSLILSMPQGYLFTVVTFLRQ